MVNSHKFYIIQRHPEKQEQITTNLTTSGITTDQIKFVKLIPQDSRLFQYYIRDCKCNLVDVQILITHLKTCRKILEKTPYNYDGSIILSDTVFLEFDWKKTLFKTLKNLPDTTNIFLFNYVIPFEKHNNLVWSGKKPDLENICKYIPGETIGFSMYWISKQQCSKVLDKVDRPMRLFSNNYSIKRILDSVSRKELLKTVFVAYPALSLLTKEECTKEEYEMNSLWTDSDKHDYYSISGEVLNNEKNVPKKSSEESDYDSYESDKGDYESSESNTLSTSIVNDDKSVKKDTEKDVKFSDKSVKKDDKKVDEKKEIRKDIKDDKKVDEKKDVKKIHDKKTSLVKSSSTGKIDKKEEKINDKDTKITQTKDIKKKDVRDIKRKSDIKDTKETKKITKDDKKKITDVKQSIFKETKDMKKSSVKKDIKTSITKEVKEDKKIVNKKDSKEISDKDKEHSEIVNLFFNLKGASSSSSEKKDKDDEHSSSEELDRKSTIDSESVSDEVCSVSSTHDEKEEEKEKLIKDKEDKKEDEKDLHEQISKSSYTKSSSANKKPGKKFIPSLIETKSEEKKSEKISELSSEI